MNFKKLKISLRRIVSILGFQIVKIRFSRWHYELYNKKESTKNSLMVNLGAGTFRHPYWTNVDMPNDFYKEQQDNLHITHDFTSSSPLPFKNESVEVFYCSHVIEHLGDDDVQKLFKEVFAALKPGGLFRVTCPDMELQYNALKRADKLFWKNLDPWALNNDNIYHLIVEHFATCCANSKRYPQYFITAEEIKTIYCENEMSQFFNTIASRVPNGINSEYPEGHVNWFHREKVTMLLKACGFKTVTHSAYLQSAQPYMRDPRFFDYTTPELSLYIEAFK